MIGLIRKLKKKQYLAMFRKKEQCKVTNRVAVSQFFFVICVIIHV